MAEKRYYYKAKNGKGYLNFKHPLSKEELNDYVEITKETFESETYHAPHVPTAEETARKEKLARIAELKRFLSSTDYCVIKIAEGAATTEEYASVIAERQAARTEINTLESEL